MRPSALANFSSSVKHSNNTFAHKESTFGENIILKIAQALTSFKPKQDYVLAIIVDTQGSTYRKTGTLMLIDSLFNYWGLLSGGCLEGDIIEHAKTVFVDKQDKTIGYDLRGEDDLLWGMGLGCEGEIRVLLKYLPAAQSHWNFFAALQENQRGQSYLMLLGLDVEHSLSFIALSKQQTQFEVDGKTTLIPKQSFHLKLANKLFIPWFAPLKILICGGSPDVPPVTAIAKQIGWQTQVIDHRRDFALTEQFPDATQVTLVKRSLWKEYSLESFDCAIVMTHQFEQDKHYLKRLLNSPIQYIGLLGPKKRRELLLVECDSNSEDNRKRVFGPVGLDIGAMTPETIALSIVAEIQAFIAGKLPKLKTKQPAEAAGE